MTQLTSNIQRIKSLLQGKFIVLSKRCPSYRTLLTIQCPVCGKIYQAQAASLLRSKGHRCSTITPEQRTLKQQQKLILLKLRTEATNIARKQWKACPVTHRRKNTVAHHILPVHNNPTRITNPDNLILLSRLAHKEFHSAYGYNTGFPELFYYITGKIIFGHPLHP